MEENYEEFLFIVLLFVVQYILINAVPWLPSLQLPQIDKPYKEQPTILCEAYQIYHNKVSLTSFRISGIFVVEKTKRLDVQIQDILRLECRLGFYLRDRWLEVMVSHYEVDIIVLMAHRQLAHISLQNITSQGHSIF